MPLKLPKIPLMADPEDEIEAEDENEEEEEVQIHWIK